MCITACLGGEQTRRPARKTGDKRADNIQPSVASAIESVDRSTVINLQRLKSLNCFDVLLREGSDIDAEVHRVRIHSNDRLLRQRCGCGRGEVQA